MMYKFAFRHAMRARFPNVFTEFDNNVLSIQQKKELFELFELQKACISWLHNNLHINYNFEIEPNTVFDDNIIDTFTFRYEQDLLAFKLRFGL